MSQILGEEIFVIKNATILKDWNFWLSLVTALVAILALYQTKQQIKLSNKQHLFDKRIENYLIARGLIELYESNRTILRHQNEEPIFSIDCEFIFLINNTYLEQMALAIRAPLEEPNHKILLVKLENLKEIAAKIKYLFFGKEADLLGDFTLSYQKLLFSMYQYQIVLRKMEKVAPDCNYEREKAQELVGEKKQRAELLKAFDNLEQAFSKLKSQNVEERINRQIKL